MVKDKQAALDDPKLQDAVKELLLASDGFRRAYEMWERAPDAEVSWERTLLEEAQSRLDSARDRVNDVEMTVARDDGPPSSQPPSRPR